MPHHRRSSLAQFTFFITSSSRREQLQVPAIYPRSMTVDVPCVEFDGAASEEVSCKSTRTRSFAGRSVNGLRRRILSYV